MRTVSNRTRIFAAAEVFFSKKPKNLTLTEAASLPETCFTVWSNVYDRAKLAPGESLLVQGGSSGIGVTAIQMARATGNRFLLNQLDGTIEIRIDTRVLRLPIVMKPRNRTFE